MGVLKLNGKEYGGGSGGSGSEDVELTIAEYLALPDTKLSDDKNYFIKDINNDNVLGYPPLIYSDNEREVGVWSDGKPLYQKTFIQTFNNIASGTETNMADVSGLNIDELADITGRVNYYNGTNWFNVNLGTYFGAYVHTDGYLTFLQTMTGQTTNRSYIVVVTLRYTKTTDTAGSGIWNGQGGYSHHYSTNETVIGTWYNGKPIYEKTYELSSALLVEYTSWTNTTIDSSNIQTVIDAKGYNADGTFYGTVMADPTRNSHALLGLQTTRNNSQANVKVLTIQYTKITD